MQDTLRAGLRAGAVAALVSGAPSTAIALARGDDLLEPVRAAASLVPGGRRSPLVAGVVAHLALSAGWGVVLAAALPRRRPVVEGLVAGALIAGLDLGVVARGVPAVRRLPQGRQWLDHLAYGVAVSACLPRPPRRRRALRPS